VPFATTVNVTGPDVAHILLLTGCVPTVTAVHVEVTVTVTVKVAPTHAPEVGVTVYIAVPIPDGIVKIPFMLA
jgi:hypothetical protein